MTAIDLRAHAASIVLLAASAMVLTGCTTTAPPSTGSDDGQSSDAGTSDVGAPTGPKCEDNTSDFEIFAADGVTNAPEYGQVWGDGTELSFDYDGFIPGSTLSYQLYYVQEDGGVINTTGGPISDPVGTTFSSVDPQYNTSTLGYYGIVEVTMLSNVEFDGEKYTGDTTPVANFCVTMAVSE